MVDAQADFAAQFLELRTGYLSGIELVLAHMEQRAEALRHIGAGVHGDDWDPGRNGLFDGRTKRRGVGNRDNQASGLLIDGRIDQLTHGYHVEGLRCPVVDLDLHVLARGSDSIFHHRPEGVVGLSVADHDNAGTRLLRRSWKCGCEDERCCCSETGYEWLHWLPPRLTR